MLPDLTPPWHRSSGNVVTIGGSVCTVDSEGPTSITCTTEAHQGPGQFEVKVTVPGKGLAATVSFVPFIYHCFLHLLL